MTRATPYNIIWEVGRVAGYAYSILTFKATFLWDVAATTPSGTQFSSNVSVAAFSLSFTFLCLPRAERVVSNLHEYGNTSAASIPLALDEVVRSGKVKPGDKVRQGGIQ